MTAGPAEQWVLTWEGWQEHGSRHRRGSRRERKHPTGQLCGPNMMVAAASWAETGLSRADQWAGWTSPVSALFPALPLIPSCFFGHFFWGFVFFLLDFKFSLQVQIRLLKNICPAYIEHKKVRRAGKPTTQGSQSRFWNTSSRKILWFISSLLHIQLQQLCSSTDFIGFTNLSLPVLWKSSTLFRATCPYLSFLLNSRKSPFRSFSPNLFFFNK